MKIEWQAFFKQSRYLAQTYEQPVLWVGCFLFVGQEPWFQPQAVNDNYRRA